MTTAVASILWHFFFNARKQYTTDIDKTILDTDESITLRNVKLVTCSSEIQKNPIFHNGRPSNLK